MDSFLQNYWSVYLDYLQDFESLEYLGFSLPFLCHLPSYLLPKPSLLTQIEKMDRKHLRNHVQNQKEIQTVFNQFVATHTKPKRRVENGKVVLHVDKLLRFPPSTMQSHFDRKKTILLINSNGPKQKQVKPTLTPQSPRTYRAKTEGKAIPLTNTVRVSKSKLKEKSTSNYRVTQNMLTYFLQKYTGEVENAIKEAQQKARKILAEFKNHPIYSDPAFQKWLLNNILVVIRQISAAYGFLKKVPVSCLVVSTTHSYVSRILSIVAAEKGIPSICMQHGIISSELGYVPKIATVDAVYGNYEKDFYQKLGAPKGSVEVIGHPRFDERFNKKVVRRATFDKKLGLNPRRKNVMIALRGEDDINRWRILIKKIDRKLKVNILIKNYPSKQPHILTKEFRHVYSTGSYGLYDIFPNVDAVVTYSSTVGLEAMLHGKPVFVLNKSFRGFTGYYHLLDQLEQTSPGVLANIIIKYFSDAKFRHYTDKIRKSFLSKAYSIQSSSGERLKTLIKRLTE